MNDESMLKSIGMVAKFMAAEFTNRYHESAVIFNNTILADKPTFEGKVTSEGGLVIIVSSENMIDLADTGKKLTRYPVDVTWDMELELEEVTLEDANQLIDTVIQELETEVEQAKGKLHMFRETIRPQTKEEKLIMEQVENLNGTKIPNPFSSGESKSPAYSVQEALKVMKTVQRKYMGDI